MADFVERLVARALSPDRAVRPRLAAPFATSPADVAGDGTPLGRATPDVMIEPAPHRIAARESGVAPVERPLVVHRPTAASGPGPGDEVVPVGPPGAAGDDACNRSTDRLPAIGRPGPGAAGEPARAGTGTPRSWPNATQHADVHDDAPAEAPPRPTTVERPARPPDKVGGGRASPEPGTAGRSHAAAPVHERPWIDVAAPPPPPWGDGELGRYRSAPPRRRDEPSLLVDAAEPPTVHVRIGRIEVRAPVPTRVRQRATPVVLPLEDYLRERAERGNR